MRNNDSAKKSREARRKKEEEALSVSALPYLDYSIPAAFDCARAYSIQ